MLREQARAEARAELAAKKPAAALRPTPLLEEDEFHGLVRALWLHHAHVATIARELGYTEGHIRRVLDQMGLQRSEATIPSELRVRCKALRQLRRSRSCTDNANRGHLPLFEHNSPESRTETSRSPSSNGVTTVSPRACAPARTASIGSCAAQPPHLGNRGKGGPRVGHGATPRVTSGGGCRHHPCRCD
jgi:hypothetical protein